MPEPDDRGALVIVSDEDAPARAGDISDHDAARDLVARLQRLWSGPHEVVTDASSLRAALDHHPVASIVVDGRLPCERWQATLAGITAGHRQDRGGTDDGAPPVLLIGDDACWAAVADAVHESGADCVHLPCDDVELGARLTGVHRLADARESERRRLARAIHDDTLQVFAAVTMRLQLLRRRVAGASSDEGPDSDDVRELDDIGEQLGDALERLRLLEFERRATEDLTAEIAAVAPAGAGGLVDDRAGHGSGLWASREMLSNLGHDLRSPLNAVLGFSQLLELGDLSPEQSDAVRQIIRAGGRLLELINEVVDLSRIEAGVLDLSVEPVELDELVRDAAELMRPAAVENEVDIRGASRSNWSVAEPDKVAVMADRQRLLQVLLILLSNAVRYNEPGGTVTVNVGRTSTAVVRISVEDTGLGIPAEKLDKVFVPFDRLGVDKQGATGSGLGLPIARGLVARMGGYLGVESAAGEGSTFWLELRAAPALASDEVLAGPAGDRPLDTSADALDVFEVLYIEDNPSSLRLVEQVLRRRPGVTMIPAMQGRLGVQLAVQRRPAMVLVDLHLPDMSGVDVVRTLAAEPATKDIPVIVLSADAVRDSNERLLAAGARAYLTKPFQIDTLLGLVDSIREERRREGFDRAEHQTLGEVRR